MSLSRHRGATVAAVAAALALTLAACGGGDSEPDADTLRIGSVGGWLEDHLEEAGLLEDLPYDVEFVDVAGAGAYGSLSAGQIDVGVWGFDANGSQSISEGSSSRIIALIGSDPEADPHRGVINLYTSAESGISSIDDLAGTTIGVNWGEGTTADVVMHAALDEAGISPDDLTLNYFSDASGSTAFLSRQVDGFVTSLNGALVEDIQENGTQPIYYANQASSVAYVIASRDDVIEDESRFDMVSDFVSRITEYYDWRGEEANLDSFTQAVMAEQSTSEDYATVVAENIGPAVQVLEFSDENVGRFQEDLDNLLDWGLVDAPVAAEDLIDDTFADAIVAARD
ncbi:ABC-type nitrate/sulfonate/bicarbonate transport systems, periplasmic components [Actinomycetales bacterium JB111]|nr:ABC-type nitrate/sulfonate/bicarbonate transport systems, periplasmic components [Actinomycetales bacterium JB111]